MRETQRISRSIGTGLAIAVAIVALDAVSDSAQPMRTIEVAPEAVAEGQALFAVCASCHGARGEGRMGIGPRLNSTSFLAAASDDLLVRTITQGRAGTTMIGWGASFESAQIEAIVAYLRSWADVPPAALDERPLEGTAAAGAETFRNICASCHGQQGGGYLESANGTGIGRSAFLSEVSNGYLRYLIQNGKSGTPMRPFSEKSRVAVANLSDRQIADVIAHLRASAW